MAIQWLGSAKKSVSLGQAQLAACGPGREGYWDVATQQVVCRDITVAGGLIAVPHVCHPQALGTNGQCVPFVCPEGTVRNLETGECYRPPPVEGECLSVDQVVAAQPCFYFDAQGKYVGPANLVEGVDLAGLYQFCLQTLSSGYFDLPLCDAPRTVPPHPSCLTEANRAILNECRSSGWKGTDRNANYFCWYALKAPAELADWEATPDCPTGSPPEFEPPPTGTAPPPQETLPGTPPATPGAPVGTTAPTKSSAVPLLLGAAVVGTIAYFLLS